MTPVEALREPRPCHGAGCRQFPVFAAGPAAAGGGMLSPLCRTLHCGEASETRLLQIPQHAGAAARQKGAAHDRGVMRPRELVAEPCSAPLASFPAPDRLQRLRRGAVGQGCNPGQSRPGRCEPGLVSRDAGWARVPRSRKTHPRQAEIHDVKERNAGTPVAGCTGSREPAPVAAGRRANSTPARGGRR